MSRLKSLKLLVLDANNLKEFPDFIGELINLRELHYCGQNLKEIPKAILNLKKLEMLSLLNNRLSSIPEEIENLENIKQLVISNNIINEIPSSIANLVNLTRLDVDDNQLEYLPERIGELKNLDNINLRGNRFNFGAEFNGLTAQEQIQEILNWQRAQKEGTLQPIHEAKIIFIGESNYGKTHLIEFLKNGNIEREINTTHGIERSQIIISHPKKDIRLNIWDLGGQEFMRSTHQFFFSERTLYVLVTLARRERNELNHWLKMVNQLGNKAPVLVVINKIDIDPHDLDRRSLERDYPNIVGFIRTTIKDCK